MLLDGRNTRPIGFRSVLDLLLMGSASRFDAEGECRKVYYDPFNQRWTCPTKCFDAATDHEAANRLANLNTDGTICMCDHTVELGKVHRPRIDIEAASALAKGFYRCV